MLKIPDLNMLPMPEQNKILKHSDYNFNKTINYFFKIYFIKAETCTN